ncbi:hypothetical protein [Streptomyces sp. NPDC048248]|uniref:hypothetical protein n=1 Tax=Streptomyces sp. NPDC048248 TaxID=3365523 RepID=UPI003715200D
MAKVRVGVLCRLLAILAAVVMALPALADGTYGGVAAAAAPAFAASATAPRAAQLAVDAVEHQETGADRCQPRRGGRSTATVPIPAPLSTPLSTTTPVHPVSGLAVTVPLTGRQAVPLSRSGELPVQHRAFRC